MKKIEIDELIERLNNKNIKLTCEGIITTNIKIEQVKISKTNDTMEIYSKEKEEVKINIHQIMKIEEITNENYIIQFDGLQIIKILLL